MPRARRTKALLRQEVATLRQRVAELETTNAQLREEISVRQQTEEALRHTAEEVEAANQEKSGFLATLSHELRTPLQVIMGYTSILLEEEGEHGAGEQATFLQRIDCSAQEILELITTVLDLSRIEVGQLHVQIEQVPIREVLEAVATESQGLFEQSGLSFEWRSAPDLPSVYTDAGRLKVVLKNLIGNAVKFTEEGSITLEARAQDEGIEIRVTDTGIGIPDEALSVIFEPFRQVESTSARQRRGSGLGLYIVKRWLELLGGSISVESEVGRGSTFRVWIPIGQPS